MEHIDTHETNITIRQHRRAEDGAESHMNKTTEDNASAQHSVRVLGRTDLAEFQKAVRGIRTFMTEEINDQIATIGDQEHTHPVSLADATRQTLLS